MSESFYTDNNFLNVSYACDISIENHFSSLLLESDLSRMVYASNAYAFRKRSSDNNGVLDMPFVNYHLTNYEPGQRLWWNNTSYTKGVYIEELNSKILYAPIVLSYEASYWCNRDDELKYAISELNFDADNKTTLTATVDIESVELPFTCVLGYSGNQYEPQYNEQDWLTQNKIHSISLNFAIETFALKTNYNITVPTSVELELYAFYGDKSVLIS